MEKDYLLEMESLKMYLEEKNKSLSKNKKIENIRYIGQAEVIELINKEEYKLNKDIYVCDIREEGIDSIIREYYSEDFKLIAREDERYAELQENGSSIMLIPEYAEHPEIMEKLIELDKEGKIDLKKIQEQNLPKVIQIAETLGIDKEDIQGISEIDLQRLQYPEQSEQIASGIQAKSQLSIDIDEHVSTRDTIGSLVNAQGEEFVKIDVVDLGKGPQFVGTKADGQMKELESVKSKYGYRPNRKINTINQDGTEIEEEYPITMFSIQGREDEQLAISVDPYNRLKTSLVRTSPETNESVSIPIEAQSQTIIHTRGEIKQLMDSNRNSSISEETRRIESEKEQGRKPIDVRNIDDNPNNNRYNDLDGEYVPETSITWQEFANKLGYRGSGSIEIAKEKFTAKRSEKPDISGTELVDEMEEEVIEQSGPDLTRNEPK